MLDLTKTSTSGGNSRCTLSNDFAPVPGKKRQLKALVFDAVDSEPERELEDVEFDKGFLNPCPGKKLKSPASEKERIAPYECLKRVHQFLWNAAQ